MKLLPTMLLACVLAGAAPSATRAQDEPTPAPEPAPAPDADAAPAPAAEPAPAPTPAPEPTPEPVEHEHEHAAEPPPDPDPDALGFGTAPVGSQDADDIGFGDPDSVGFGDDAGFAPAEPSAGEPELSPLPSPRAWSATSFVRLDSALWVERFDSNPFAKMRASGDLALRYHKGDWRIHLAGHIETDFAYLVDDYDQATRDEYQFRMIARESFVAYEAGPVELSFGYHIEAWGEGDAVSIVDVVNPRDVREPGLADLDDLRLPVLSSVLSFFWGYHRVEAMVIHEGNYGLRSPPFGPFSPVTALITGSDAMVGGVPVSAVLASANVGFQHEPPRYSAEAQQVLGRWMYKGPGVDLGLYAANVLDQTGVIRDIVPTVTIDPMDPTDISVTAANVVLDHLRYTMLGQSGAAPVGDFVFKWELGAQLDRPVNTGAPNDPTAFGIDRAQLVGGLLGASYGGIPDTDVFLEVAQSWLVNDLTGPLLFPFDAANVALRSTTTFLKERLTLALAFTMWGWRAQYGSLVRGQLDYTVLDGLSVGAGFITYQPTSKVGPIYGFTDHDRVFAQLRYDFTML